ncbi:MAG: tryptophan synthase subunit alpha [Omnitrophica WOR_2 bacterium RIFCSPHIGHO2_02_FULL_52_10]|nr:MAG: tryptophan synthase subunit alpha [Omnitrophica WOR_2 bacterium RIFCSPHIGHO2_02_FULL_52_10]
MNRIDQKFKELRKKRQKAFIAFVTAGDPALRITEELVLSFERNGVDIVELGVPFSDPLADGATIQASSQRALQNAVNIPRILNTVKRIRQQSQIPIALMTYYNPVYHYGEQKFVQDAKRSGVDGIIIPDLPPEEAEGIIRHSKRNDMATIFFLAPTSTRQRVRRIVKQSTGFIYYVALTGVTGARKGFDRSNAAKIRSFREFTTKPICVGFGVSTPVQVKAAAKVADGVIVGSAIVDRINRNAGKRDCVTNVSGFVRTLARALKVRE